MSATVNMPDLPSFRVIPANENVKLSDMTLSDGTPMVGPDGMLVPPARSFSAIVNAATRVYSYRFDEAMRDNFVAARAMRRDAFLLGLFEERILPTINRTWALEVDDETDPAQTLVRDGLTRIVQSIPDFDQFKRANLEGVWFGRGGTQWAFDRDAELDNMWSIPRWDPLHGDSIQFTFDGHPAILLDTLTTAWYADHGAKWNPLGHGDLCSTDRGGNALVLRRPYWRNRFSIHTHIRQKADYFEGELAGSVQGFGLRGQVYLLYTLRSNALTWMITYMQAVGAMDLLVFNFPAGNDAAKRQQEANANKVIGKAAIVCPRNPTGNWPAVEQIQMNSAGMKALHDLVADYFDRHIERLFVGQSMSAGADKGTGLGGTGRAEFTRACVPVEGSEILTRDGFKSPHDVPIGEDVLAYDAETDTCKWTPLLKKSFYENAEVVRLSAPGFDAVCTPDHSWVIRDANRKYRLVKANEFNKDHTLIVGAFDHEGREGNACFCVDTNQIVTEDAGRTEVWCPTTKYGTWVMRQNGRTTITGNTKDEILVYDTGRLDSTLTYDLIRPLKKYNYPWAKFPVRFKSVLPDLKAAEKVEAGSKLISIGVPIKLEEFRSAADFSTPEQGDQVVATPVPGAPPIITTIGPDGQPEIPQSLMQPPPGMGGPPGAPPGLPPGMPPNVPPGGAPPMLPPGMPPGAPVQMSASGPVGPPNTAMMSGDVPAQYLDYDGGGAAGGGAGAAGGAPAAGGGYFPGGSNTHVTGFKFRDRRHPEDVIGFTRYFRGVDRRELIDAERSTNGMFRPSPEQQKALNDGRARMMVVPIENIIGVAVDRPLASEISAERERQKPWQPQPLVEAVERGNRYEIEDGLATVKVWRDRGNAMMPLLVWQDTARYQKPRRPVIYGLSEDIANMRRQIAANPEHGVPGANMRLVLADALDEAGESEQARQLREFNGQIVGQPHGGSNGAELYTTRLDPRTRQMTHFPLGLHDNAITALQNAHANNQSVHVHLGTTTEGDDQGRDWIEENGVRGRVGFSSGPLRYPIIFAPNATYGNRVGDYVVRIRGNGGQELYRHPKYNHGTVTVGPGWKGVNTGVYVNGKPHAGFSDEKKARAWAKRMGLTVDESGQSVPSTEPPTQASRYARISIQPGESLMGGADFMHAIHDEGGNRIGHVWVSPMDNGERLHINHVGAMGHEANSLGPAVLRDAMRQLRGLYPQAKRITGTRISGATKRNTGEDRPADVQFARTTNYADELDPQEQAAFEAKIDENPLDPLNHGVYADWLQDRGHNDEAAFRRWMGGFVGSGHPQRSSRDQDSRFPWVFHHHFDMPEGVNRDDIPEVPSHRVHLSEDEDGNVFLDPDVRDGEAFDVNGNDFRWRTYRDMEHGLRRAFTANLKRQRAQQQQLPTQASRYDRRNAPKGGVDFNGRKYRSGQFVPGGMMLTHTPKRPTTVTPTAMGRQMGLPYKEPTPTPTNDVHHEPTDFSSVESFGHSLARAVSKHTGDRNHYQAALELASRLTPPVFERLKKNGLKHFVSHATPESLSKHWREDDPDLVEGIHSGTNREIHLGGNDPVGIAAHELMHELDWNEPYPGGGGYSLSSSPDWQQAWKQEIANSGGKLSDYAGESPKEGLAELGRLLWSHPQGIEQAARDFPQSVAVMKKWGVI